MAYNDQRAYIGTASLAAQNAVFTASGAIAAGTTAAIFFTSEPTYICSIAGYISSAASSFPSTVKFYVLVGTNTTTGQITPSPAGAVLQTNSTASFNTFNPPVAVAGGSVFSVGMVATGTASATQTLSAIQIIAGVGPQYV